MKNLEISHNILLNEIYKGDQLIFELTLNKIDDTKLKLGLLFELLSKPDDYEANREDVAKMIHLQATEDILENPDLIIEYQKYFLDSFQPYIQQIVKVQPTSKDCEDCVSFLETLKKYPEDVIWYENDEILNEVKSLSPKAQQFLKKILIDGEHYQEVVYLDKCLNLNGTTI
jgi:hypothetical protein